MKMEQIECSETSAYKIQKPGNYPEESIQHSEHGESFLRTLLPIYERHGVKPYNDVKLRVVGICVTNSNIIRAIFVDVFRQGVLKVTDEDYCLMKCDALYSGNIYSRLSKTCSLLFRIDFPRKWKKYKLIKCQ